jgi:hypothetical protein
MGVRFSLKSAWYSGGGDKSVLMPVVSFHDQIFRL